LEFDDIFSGLQSNSESSKNAAANALFNQIMTPGIRHLMKKWRFPEQDAEEVMMISMEKMFLKINSVKDSKAFKSWCWTVIENSAHDFYKARKRKAETPLYMNIDDDGEEAIIELNLESNMNTELVDVSKCLEQAWANFENDFPERAYVIEQQVEGYSIEEIAIKIERSEAATKEFISQSKKFKDKYLKKCKEEGDNDQ
jgi:RNA polymerase sigma-70 factor (ECF subfamily)